MSPQDTPFQILAYHRYLTIRREIVTSKSRVDCLLVLSAGHSRHKAIQRYQLPAGCLQNIFSACRPRAQRLHLVVLLALLFNLHTSLLKS